MHNLLLSVITTTTTTTMPTAAAATTTTNNHNHNHNHQSAPLCKHSPSATLDLLILILVLFSGTFLVTSYLSYIFNSLSLLFSLHNLSPSYTCGFFVFFVISFILFQFFFCSSRSRRCDRPNCKGLNKALEFDLQLQTEETIKSNNSNSNNSNSNKEIDNLPWKGGSETNPDYECLRAELRKMAPVNGRAVLLFRARCGCPLAKLQGWGPKRGLRPAQQIIIADYWWHSGPHDSDSA
ncbi:hypothetical protein ACFE04_005464 [Oxalis oulophora]